MRISELYIADDVCCKAVFTWCQVTVVHCNLLYCLLTWNSGFEDVHFSLICVNGKQVAFCLSDSLPSKVHLF